MLERTATTIEPCSTSLQRILPSARSCLQSRRNLHASFWNHGASEIELLDACQALMRLPSAGSKSQPIPTTSPKRPEPTTASALLLDFLYPAGAAALLQRAPPLQQARLEPLSRTQPPLSRLFTSAPPRQAGRPPYNQTAAEEDESAALEEPEEEVWEDEDDFGLELPGVEKVADETSTAPTYSDPEALWKLLRSSDRVGAYDQIYQLYVTLDPDLKDEFTTEVLLAIALSTRPIEAWRVNELFEQHSVEEWTEDLIRAAVKAQLSLHNVPAAMSIFRQALERRKLGGALDSIATYGFEVSAWIVVFEAWELYSSNLRVGEEEAVSKPLSAGKPARPVAASTESTNGSATEKAAKVVGGEGPVVQQPGSGAPTETEIELTDGMGSSIAEQGPKGVVEEAPMAEGKPTVEKDAVVEETSVIEEAPVAEEEAVVEKKPVTEELVTEPPSTNAITQPAIALTEARGMGSSATEESTKGPSYPLLAARDDFEAKVKSLYNFARTRGENRDRFTALVESFLRHLIRHSLDLFRPSAVSFMLDRVQDVQIYERFIVQNAQQKRNRLASDLYRKYRALPDVQVAKSVLANMIDVFNPHDARGMELVREDWYRVYHKMNRRAYLLFMIFYAARGDVKSVVRLGKEYHEYYDPRFRDDPRFVSHIMHAYAKKGDVIACRQTMEQAAEKTGTPPTLAQWNILLNATKKTGDYGATIDLFSQICAESEPDAYTFSTMMTLAGFRGDLQFTLELFQVAQERGIQPTMPMLRPLVDAYCQNDRYDEAEKLCESVTKKREIPGNYTRLWNKLIHHNAKRRDLSAVNRLLEVMSVQGIAYDQETYSHLLLGLLYARQAHHAMHLLRVAQREGAFEPTADHYILLMAAFIATGEPHMALRTNQLMNLAKYPKSAKRMTLIMDALGRWEELPPGKRQGVDGQQILQRIMSTFYEALRMENEGSPDDVHSVVGLYAKLTFILTQMREFTTVQQIIALHNTRSGRGSYETMPLRLLHSIMLADFYERRYDCVKEVWQFVFNRSINRFQPASTFLSAKAQQRQEIAADEISEPGNSELTSISYRERFRLSDPLKTMQRMYIEEGDAEGLLALVASVRARGFELDAKNWNYHVQGLARLKKWREAFTTCEEILMPQWTGWLLARVSAKMTTKLPLDMRRMGRNVHRPKPITHTLLILTKEYMDLEQMTLWSLEAAREFKFITDKCPRTVRALTSMVRSGTDLEADIFGDDFRRRAREHRDERTPYDWERYGQEGLDGEEYDEWGVEEEAVGEQGEEEKPGKKRKKKKSKASKMVVPEGEAWTDGGFLNAPNAALGGKKADLDKEDILSALKGEKEE
ncbi:hypothetical protein N0V88_002949 [Collariella sp. IMI 366227]|nr:hypothetical protein N0V88_002949 [Collariella sp. IMI 366227]